MPRPASRHAAVLATRALCAGTLLVSCVAPGQPGGPRAGGNETKTSVGTLAAPGTLPTPSPGLPAPAEPAGARLPASPGLAAGVAPADLPAATLSGVVRVPAAILANNGGGIVSNNGGSLISDQGSGLITDNGAGLITRTKYGLRAVVEERPYAGATVRLQDAKGQQVATTTTDEAGRYRFEGELPRQNLVLRVELPGEAGAVQAVVARKTAAITAVDVDLVSTLTTTYVLDRYVQTQAIDPQTTLDKLPADVEAETRAKAGAALAASGPLALDALTPVALVNTVEALRQADSSLDGQLERVKQLLVVAGLSDFGAGSPATEVPLGQIESLALAADGTLYIADALAHRVWRLETDGMLRTAAGRGTPSESSLDGLPAREAGLQWPRALALDAKDRLLILDRPKGNASSGGQRLTRLEADGRLRELIAALDMSAAEPEPDGAISLYHTPPRAWSRLSADGTRTLIGELAGDSKSVAALACASGRDADGRIYVHEKAALRIVDGKSQPTSPGIHRTGPGDAAFVQLLDREADGLKSLALDRRGNAFYFDNDRQLRVLKPDGTRLTLARAPELGVSLRAGAVALVGDDEAYVATSPTLLHRVRAGTFERVAGLDLASRAGALTNPAGLAFDDDGRLLLAQSRRIWRVEPDGRLTALAGTGERGDSGAGGVASTIAFGILEAIGRDARGNLFLVDHYVPGTVVLEGRGTGRILRIAPDGVVTKLYENADRDIVDMAVTPAGEVYFSEFQAPLPDKPVNGDIKRIGPDGGVAVVVADRPRAAMGRGADGALYFQRYDGTQKRWTLVRWRPVDGERMLASVAEGDADPLGLRKLRFGLGAITADAQGRLYLAPKDANQILRWDPQGGEPVVVAGDKGAHFAGITVDESILDPRYLTFAPNGDLHFVDFGHKQVKRIPAADL